MLKKTVETTENDQLRTSITTTWLLFGYVIFQKSIDKSLQHTFPSTIF